MRFGPVPVKDAEGALLAHAVQAGERRFPKAHRVSAGDIGVFRSAGIEEVVAAILETWRPRRERGSHAHCRGNRRAQYRGEAGRHRPRQFARGGCRRLHCRCRKDRCHQRGRSGDYHSNARRQGHRRTRTDGRDGEDHPLRGRRGASRRRRSAYWRQAAFRGASVRRAPCRHRSHRAARPQGQCDRQDDARYRGAAGAIRQRGDGRTASGSCGRKPWPTR